MTVWRFQPGAHVKRHGYAPTKTWKVIGPALPCHFFLGLASSAPRYEVQPLAHSTMGNGLTGIENVSESELY